jgi:hypothetical protein
VAPRMSPTQPAVAYVAWVESGCGLRDYSSACHTGIRRAPEIHQALPCFSESEARVCVIEWRGLQVVRCGIGLSIASVAPDLIDFQADWVSAYVASGSACGFSPETIGNAAGLLNRIWDLLGVRRPPGHCANTGHDLERPTIYESDNAVQADWTPDHPWKCEHLSRPLTENRPQALLITRRVLSYRRAARWNHGGHR